MRVHAFVTFFLMLDVLTVSAWGKVLTIGPLRVDFFLPALAWYAINTSDGFLGCIIAAQVGIFCDLISGDQIGLYTLVVPGTFLFMKYIVLHAAMDLWWQRVLLVVVSSFMFQAVLRTSTGYIETVWPWGALQALLDGAEVLVVFPMLAGTMPLLEGKSHE